MSARLLPLLLLAAPVHAQSGARIPVQIDTTTTGAPTGIEIATGGDLSAVLYEDGDASTVHVAVSDGRGLSWSDPVRIDTDTSGAAKRTGALVPDAMATLAVSGDAIYATWIDERNAGPGGAGGAEARDVFFARSLDGGVTWEQDFALDKGYPPGGVSPVSDWGMVVAPDPAGDHIYVLQKVDPNHFAFGNLELYLTASHDGGATFGSAVQVAPGNETVRSISLAADGDTLHLAYSSLPGSAVTAAWDVFYRRSTDAGASFAPRVQLDASGVGVGDAQTEMLVATDGSTVAVAWPEADIGASQRDLHARVSTDGGLTFGADTIVGDYAPGTVQVDEPQLSVRNGEVLLGWIDDRLALFFEFRAYASRSTDGGLSWSADELLGDNDGAQILRMAASGTTDDVVAAWVDYPSLEGTFTRSFGASFDELAKDVSGPNPISVLTQRSSVAFNELYGNGLYAWVGDDGGGDEHLYAGGFRPQKVFAQGFVAGPTMVWFELEDFDGTDPSAWVFLSASQGNVQLPFGDGRSLALTPGTLFLQTVNNPGTFLTALSPAGDGMTPQVPITLPPGFVVYGAAVSLSLTTLEFGELTDVITINF